MGNWWYIPALNPVLKYQRLIKDSTFKQRWLGQQQLGLVHVDHRADWYHHELG